MASSAGDYYRRLHLSPHASYQDIKTAFRRLARQYHPDLHPNQPDAIAKFHAIQEAYEVLKDRVQRRHYDQSLLRQQKGRQESYRNSASSVPGTADEFYLRGIRSAIAHRYEDAIADFTQAIVLDAQLIEAYIRRAEVRYILDDDSGVLVDCQRAIALWSKTGHAKPNATTASQIYYYQGMARCRLGYVESAIAAFSDAIRYDHEDARYFYRRGIAHQELHSYSKAAKDLRRSAQLYRDQGDLASYHHLQQVLSTFKLPRRSPLIRFRQLTRRGKTKRHSRPEKSSTGTSGYPAILQLLSNPAGEMIPLYQRLTPHQTNMVGYGLAILANLCFVLGTTQQLESSSWLIASQLWLAGGLMFVAMMLVVSLARACLRLSGLWASDIFMLGTAITPLGLLAIISAILPNAARLIAGDRGPWLAHIALLMATLWALAHTVLTIQNGLIHIHPFPAKMAAWLAPLILGLGLAAGMTTWGVLAN
ncbi:MAG: DnaJ domain-containing protein [Phormidesmis sp.]